jgi:hypothetical protein
MCGRRIDAVIRWVTAIAGLYFADVAQLVERVLGKDEVTGSIPVISSRSPGFRPSSGTPQHPGDAMQAVKPAFCCLERAQNAVSS